MLFYIEQLLTKCKIQFKSSHMRDLIVHHRTTYTSEDGVLQSPVRAFQDG